MSNWLIVRSRKSPLAPNKPLQTSKNPGYAGVFFCKILCQHTLKRVVFNTVSHLNHYAMNPLNWSYRTLSALGALVCFGAIAYALYVQYHMLMLPCPLCIFQRIAFGAAGVFFLFGALHNPAGPVFKRFYGLMAMLSALVGAGVAGRHVAIQLMPANEALACSGMGLDYMLEAMPLTDVLSTVLKGSGECAKIDWSFLGFSMPMWTLVLYAGIFVLAVFASFKKY
jgi:disulfide bond formation protein DsbB